MLTFDIVLGIQVIEVLENKNYLRQPFVASLTQGITLQRGQYIVVIFPTSHLNILYEWEQKQ